MTREKQPDEIFCQSCGETIKKEAEICPECGVRNTASTSTSAGHDPSEYETTVSDSWYYGIVAGTVAWSMFFVLSIIYPNSGENPLMAIFILAAWAILPVSLYFDSQYIRANSKWNPEIVLWSVGGAIPLVNIVAGSVYLYRRHEVLGIIR